MKEPNPHRTLRIAAALLALFTVTVIAMVATLFVQFDQFEDDRATARVSSCNQAVDFATAHNELVRAGQDFLEQIKAGSTNPEAVDFFDAQIATYDLNIVAVRDCSPAGLQSFADGTGGYLP